MARRGFTLIEIMIATTILGIIMLTVYGVLSRALYAKNHSEDRAELYASGREVVLKIADELEGALPPTAGRNIGFIGIPGTGRTPSDAVQFALVVRRLYGVSQNRGGRALVSYSLDPMQNTRSLFALRRQEQLLTDVATDDLNADSVDEAAAAPAPVAFAAYLLDQVAGLRFRYLNPQGGEWTDSWDTTVQVPTGQPPIGLPGAVEVTLFLADSQGGVHDFSTIVDLPLYAPPPTPGVQR
ncbi:MAG: gspJ [Deltaproteobacteria bacterium]|jgi:prepilin-type N-terminal cleavage/methylation domain-containing protein|nr:gspJ [Deltaproteobacteria bacterium]